MAAPILHIVFTDAGAEVLRAALVLAGRDERVLALDDDLAVDPLADRPEKSFWTEALAQGSRRVVWTDRRVARQYAGLLAFVGLAGAASFEVIDLTHACDWPLPMLQPDAVVALLGSAVSISAEAREDLAMDWTRLVAENAPLRAIVAGELVSVPVTAFDDAILAQCSTYWMRRLLVVGMVLSEELWTHRVWNLSQYVIESRIDALIAGGRLQAGEGSKAKRQPEIRLADEIRQSG